MLISSTRRFQWCRYLWGLFVNYDFYDLSRLRALEFLHFEFSQDCVDRFSKFLCHVVQLNKRIPMIPISYRFWWLQCILSVIFQKSNMFDNSLISGYFLTKHSFRQATIDADSDEKKIFWKFSKFRSIFPLSHIFIFSDFFHAYAKVTTNWNSVYRANFWCLTTWACQFFKIPTFYQISE